MISLPGRDASVASSPQHDTLSFETIPYRRDQMKTSNRFIIALIAGALVGAIAGLLLAPNTGKETRHVLATRADGLWQRLRSYTSIWRRREAAEPSGDEVRTYA
jgi:gas vesicle protein